MNEFKAYKMIMTPDGKLVDPASCWVFEVNVFSQADIERMEREGARLSDLATKYGAEDLTDYVS